MDGCLDRTSLRGLGLPGPASRQTPKLPMLGEYDFTCLSLKSQAVEKKKRDEMPLGKAPRGQEEDEERARGRLSSSRTWWDAASRSQTPFMLQLSPGIPGEPDAWPRDPSPLPQWADALVSLSRLGSEHLHVLM